MNKQSIILKAFVHDLDKYHGRWGCGGRGAAWRGQGEMRCVGTWRVRKKRSMKNATCRTCSRTSAMEVIFLIFKELVFQKF